MKRLASVLLRLPCHGRFFFATKDTKVHKRILLLLTAVTVLAILLHAVGGHAQEAVRYLSPGDIALSPNGESLYIVCEKADELLVLDTHAGQVKARVAVGHHPRGLALSSGGQQIYVANSWDDTVSVIDAQELKVSRTLRTGFEPTGVIADRSGKTLYVANRLSNDVSVLDLTTGDEVKRLAAGRGASYLAISADGSQIYCTHIYPNVGAFRAPPQSEITVIDTASHIGELCSPVQTRASGPKWSVTVHRS